MVKRPYTYKIGAYYSSIHPDKSHVHDEITPVAERLREQLKDILGRYAALRRDDVAKLKKEDGE